MRRTILWTALASLAAAPAAAQVRSDCGDWQTDARNVFWEDPTRTFAEGAVRLVALETGEPACCGAHLMVTWPNPDEPFPACAVISAGGNGGGIGFYSLDLSATEAREDEAKLFLTVAATATAPDGSDPQPRPFAITIDLFAGELSLE